MRLGYFGHGPWAHRALARVLADPAFAVAFVATRTVGDAVLEAAARGAGLPFLRPADVNAPATRAELAAHGAELFVSMSFDQVFRRELLALPPRGTVNCHAGALPFYRGRNVLNWALINGADRFGVTVHRVEEGIDTGPILRQDFVPIGPDETYAELLAKAHERCAATLHAALADLAAGRAAARPQAEIHPVGFYCGVRRPGDEWIDWTRPARDIHNLVRALAPPGPCARTLLDGRVVAIARSATIPGAPDYVGRPGEVVGRDPGGVVVKTGDSTLRVVAAATLESDAAPPPAMAVPRLRIGTRFEASVSPRLLALEARVAELERRLKG